MNLSILPPPPDCCPICAVKHLEHHPHNPQSFYYQFTFSQANGRSATWEDAMSHCPPAIQEFFIEYLTRMGIDIRSTKITGDIKTQEDCDARMNRVENSLGIPKSRNRGESR